MVERSSYYVVLHPLQFFIPAEEHVAVVLAAVEVLHYQLQQQEREEQNDNPEQHDEQTKSVRNKNRDSLRSNNSIRTNRIKRT